jgi:hypothetical protein
VAREILPAGVDQLLPGGRRIVMERKVDVVGQQSSLTFGGIHRGSPGASAIDQKSVLSVTPIRFLATRLFTASLLGEIRAICSR